MIWKRFLYEVKDSGEDIMCHFVGGGDMNLMAWMVPYEAFGSEAAYGAVYGFLQRSYRRKPVCNRYL